MLSTTPRCNTSTSFCRVKKVGGSYPPELPGSYKPTSFRGWVVDATTEYLELFFSNLLLGAGHELRNRQLHIGYSAELEKLIVQSAAEETLKSKNGTLNCTLDELKILKILIEEPAITQAQLADRLNKSLRTVKSNMAKLKEKGYIKRTNGRRFGHWDVLVELLF